MRTNIVLNDKLVDEAFSLTGLRTKKELVDLALQELIRIRKKKDLIALAGRIRFQNDFDHKQMRAGDRDPG